MALIAIFIIGRTISKRGCNEVVTTGRSCLPTRGGPPWGMLWCSKLLQLVDIQTSCVTVVSQLWADQCGESRDLGLPQTVFVLTTSRFNPIALGT